MRTVCTACFDPLQPRPLSSVCRHPSAGWAPHRQHGGHRLQQALSDQRHLQLQVSQATPVPSKMLHALLCLGRGSRLVADCSHQLLQLVRRHQNQLPPFGAVPGRHAAGLRAGSSVLHGTEQPPAPLGQGCEGWLGACLRPALGFSGSLCSWTSRGCSQVPEVGCSL